MRILADEGVPAQLVGMLRALLPGHEVRGVGEIKWSGRDDVAVLSGAAERGFDAFLSRDTGQYTEPGGPADPTAHGLHHIRYHHPPGGRRGMATAMGAVIAEMTEVVQTLARTPTPTTIHISPGQPTTTGVRIERPVRAAPSRRQPAAP